MPSAARPLSQYDPVHRRLPWSMSLAQKRIRPAAQGEERHHDGHEYKIEHEVGHRRVSAAWFCQSRNHSLRRVKNPQMRREPALRGCKERAHRHGAQDGCAAVYRPRLQLAARETEHRDLRRPGLRLRYRQVARSGHVRNTRARCPMTPTSLSHARLPERRRKRPTDCHGPARSDLPEGSANSHAGRASRQNALADSRLEDILLDCRCAHAGVVLSRFIAMSIGTRHGLREAEVVAGLANANASGRPRSATVSPFPMRDSPALRARSLASCACVRRSLSTRPTEGRCLAWSSCWYPNWRPTRTWSCLLRSRACSPPGRCATSSMPPRPPAKSSPR